MMSMLKTNVTRKGVCYFKNTLCIHACSYRILILDTNGHYFFGMNPMDLQMIHRCFRQEIAALRKKLYLIPLLRFLKFIVYIREAYVLVLESVVPELVKSTEAAAPTDFLGFV